MDYLIAFLACLAIALLGLPVVLSGAPRNPYWRRPWLYRLERHQAKQRELRAPKPGTTRIPVADDNSKSKHD